MQTGCERRERDVTQGTLTHNHRGNARTRNAPSTCPPVLWTVDLAAAAILPSDRPAGPHMTTKNPVTIIHHTRDTHMRTRQNMKHMMATQTYQSQHHKYTKSRRSGSEKHAPGHAHTHTWLSVWPNRLDRAQQPAGKINSADSSEQERVLACRLLQRIFANDESAKAFQQCACPVCWCCWLWPARPTLLYTRLAMGSFHCLKRISLSRASGWLNFMHLGGTNEVAPPFL